MKFKKQDTHSVFPPSSVTSNIRDTKIGHVDLSKFLKRIERSSYYHQMESIIDSGIHLIETFPMSAQDSKFVMAVANHFDPVSRSVKDETGKKLIRLDEEFFDSIFKCPSTEKYFDITMQSAIAYFDRKSNKCKKKMNGNWLQTPRPTIIRCQKLFPDETSLKKSMV